MSRSRLDLPEIPLEAWEDTKITLHYFTQVIGKIRMALMPRRNHWWNVTLYVGTRGLTTGPMPFDEGQETCEILIHLGEHHLEVTTSRGERRALDLYRGVSVAALHDWLMGTLGELGIHPRILAKPYDLSVETPFSQITQIAAYEPEPIGRFFRVLRWVDGVFQEWSGRFYGKTCPVHVYWHGMDLAVTRFSGRRGPAMAADRKISDKEAYSHEVISCGFWAGDERVREPAFYSYTYPSPEGLAQEPLAPASARWEEGGGSPMAMLMYKDLRVEADPRGALLSFMESAYQAGAKRAGWDIADFRVPPLREL